MQQTIKKSKVKWEMMMTKSSLIMDSVLHLEIGQTILTKRTNMQHKLDQDQEINKDTELEPEFTINIDTNLDQEHKKD